MSFEAALQWWEDWQLRLLVRPYTKHKASFGGLLRAAVVLLTFVDIGLFQRSHRNVYDRADVVVTYVLLCCTAALEFVSACLVLGSGLPKPDDQLAQYNLVSYLASKRGWGPAAADEQVQAREHPTISVCR